jgi:hypothetical protein
MSKDSTCHRFVDLTSAYVRILSSPAADTSEISKVRKLESGKSSLSDYMKWGDNALGIQRQVPRCEGARQLNCRPRKEVELLTRHI